MSAPEGSVTYKPFDAEVRADPYPFNALLREHAPAFHVAEQDIWRISRYADVAAAVTDTASSDSAFGDSDRKGSQALRPRGSQLAVPGAVDR